MHEVFFSLNNSRITYEEWRQIRERYYDLLIDSFGEEFIRMNDIHCDDRNYFPDVAFTRYGTSFRDVDAMLSKYAIGGYSSIGERISSHTREQLEEM